MSVLKFVALHFVQNFVIFMLFRLVLNLILLNLSCRHDPYAAATSLGGLSQVPPRLMGDSLLERMPTRLDDVHSLSSYRDPISIGFNLG